jgi:serine/threonine-protein phosphatase PGAM5
MGTRHILLIRHGQYDEEHDGGLTDLGREQAHRVGAALRGVTPRTIFVSTLRRARETAAIVSAHFPDVPVRKMRLLCEAVPTTIPRLPGFASAARIRADRTRADAAFAKLFRPARASCSDVVVAHGNIIRFFVCKALGIPPITWVKLGSVHCGVTEVLVEPSGYMRLRSFNDTGHLPRRMRTMSLAPIKQD